MAKIRPSERVHKYIMDGIMSGKWKTGMQIPSENELVSELSVGRVSVREAFEKLVALGILEKRQGQGTFVSQMNSSSYFNSLIPMVLLDFNAESALEVLEFRRLLDVESARLCSIRADEDDIKKIEYNLKMMEKNINDPDVVSDYDIQFHVAISNGSKNNLIIKVHEILFDILRLHQKNSAYFGAEPNTALNFHRKILGAIKEHDEELASLYMKRHINYTIDRIKRQNSKKEMQHN